MGFFRKGSTGADKATTSSKMEAYMGRVGKAKGFSKLGGLSILGAADKAAGLTSAQSKESMGYRKKGEFLPVGTTYKGQLAKLRKFPGKGGGNALSDLLG